MSKPMLGALVGTALGLLDGLSSLFYPEAAAMIGQIVIGSTLKGLVTGLLAGVFSRRLRSLLLGIGVALAVGLALSLLAASVPDAHGQHHYFAIMLPGGILGAIVGLATQRLGAAPEGVS